MRIAFVANHDKTVFFAAVAARLLTEGHQIYWISPGRRLARWIRRQGYESRSVLDLTELSMEWTRRNRHESIYVPVLAGEMQIGDMIAADRFLRTKNPLIALRYLMATSNAITTFVDREGIDVVLGEQTYAFELFAGVTLASIDVPYYAPATVRIPSDRFALFPAPDQARLASGRDPSQDELSEAAMFVDRFREQPSKPYYFQRNQGGLRPEISWLWAPVKQLILGVQDPHELNRPTLSWLLKDRPRRVTNGIMAGREHFKPATEVGDVDYVLFPLHRQPEASIDVLAFRYSDQAAVVEAVARDLPKGWLLVVKEHSNGLGDRPPHFYRRLRQIENVVLVDPWCDSISLARRARLVFTLSGTLAYEAGLLGLPAATGVPMYFRDFLIRDGLSPLTGELREVLRDLEQGRLDRTDTDNVAVSLAAILANSAPGFIGAHTDTPECMDPTNVINVAMGIERLLGLSLQTSGPNE